LILEDYVDTFEHGHALETSVYITFISIIINVCRRGSGSRTSKARDYLMFVAVLLRSIDAISTCYLIANIYR